MSPDLSLLLFFFFISIFFSFLCSIWEAVFLSIPPSYVGLQLQEGSRTGQLLKEFKENVDRPLSAILTLNTIAHTVGAMGVGMQAEKLFEGTEMKIGNFNLPFSSEALIGALMTLAILILSEIIPKTLGANYWKRLTPFTVTSLNLLVYVLYPFVWLSQIITKKLKKDKNRSVFSRAEFTVMAEIGEQEGVFKQEESKIIRNLLRFNTIQAKDIMTPRTVVKAEDQNTTIEAFYAGNKNLHFSRIPIYEESKDNITGFVLKDEILSKIISGEGARPLSTINREIMIVTEQIALPDLFNRLMEELEHIALVVDEFRGMSGIITMEDVIETLLGMEIVDELDNIEDMQLLARKNWEKRARNLGLIEVDQGKDDGR